MVASVIVFLLYIVLLVAIGIVTYMRTKSSKDYMLAGRANNKWVTAISAESSDMSGWLLMGLPGAAYSMGFAAIWTLIGLLFGTMLNWMISANRLRVASEVYDCLSVTEFFEKRVNDTKGTVGLISGIAVLIIMIINSSAEIIGSGKLLNATFGLNYSTGIIIAMFIVIVYTFLGGYMAVSWSNLFQGSLMFFVMLLVPIIVVFKMGGLNDFVATMSQTEGFFHWTNGLTGFGAFSTIAGGIGIGVCYFGVVHVLTCFMSIKDSSEIKDSTFIGTTWVSITSYAAVIIGMLGAFLFPTIADPEQVFFQMGKDFFPAGLLGLFAATVMAAILSSVSAYIIVATGAVSTNIVKHFIKDLDDKKTVMISRISVLVIAVLAYLMSLNSGVVFAAALLATALLGSCFGPLVLMSLYTKNVNKTGAIASILTGLIVVIVWYYSGLSNYIYEAVPGMVISAIVLVVVTRLTGGPSAESVAKYEEFEREIAARKEK